MTNKLDAAEYIIGSLAVFTFSAAVGFAVIRFPDITTGTVQVISALLGAFGTLTLAFVTVETARQNSRLITKQEEQLEEMRKNRERAEIEDERPIAQEVFDSIILESIEELGHCVLILQNNQLDWDATKGIGVQTEGLANSTNIRPVTHLDDVDDTVTEWATGKYPDITERIEAHYQCIAKFEEKCEDFKSDAKPYIASCLKAGLEQEIEDRDLNVPYFGVNPDTGMDIRIIKMIIEDDVWNITDEPFMQPRDLVREDSMFSDIDGYEKAKDSFEEFKEQEKEVLRESAEVKNYFEEIKKELSQKYTIYPDKELE